MSKPLQRIPAFQLALSEQQFRAIGHMITQWAFLESEINREIRWLLRRGEHKGKRVNFQARFSARTNNWAKLAEKSYKKHPKHIKAVLQVAGRANTIKRERDDISHGNLGSSGIFFQMADGEVTGKSDTIGTPAHIEDLACRIADITAMLWRHHVALRRYHRKLPR